MFPDRFRLAPLTVLVDPARAEDLNRNPDIAVLFRKQLEEADVVCFTKSDRHSAPLPAGIPNGRRVSAFTGQGVAAWLDEVLSGAIGFSGATLDIDYARYAEAEASLAWLNADVELTFDPPLSPAMALGPFLDRLDAALTREGIRIAHLKALDRTPTGYVKAALCANGEEPVAEGALDASPATRHHLLLNLRASASPEPVRTIVEDALSQIPARPANLRINSFRPAAPKPEFRLAGPFAAGSFF
jgi:hypothetical protein